MPQTARNGFADTTVYTPRLRDFYRGRAEALFRTLQLRILCFGFFQDGDVGVCILPEGEKLLVVRVRFGSVAM
jgi:hypothetical protein